MSKYVVGDIVEIVDNRSCHGFEIGELVEVVWVNTVIGINTFDVDCFVTNNDGLGYYVTDVEIHDYGAYDYDPDEPKPDMVNSPAHYGSGKIECIDYIKDFLTPEEFIGYLRGNIAKYNHRWRYKNGIEDLKKSDWYLDYLIDFMVEQDVQNSK